MASTSSRTLKLLSLLESRREWSGDALAERLEVSVRTVRRDIDALRDLGYPVHGSKGPYGRYQLGAGSTLPPLMFDDDQAMAVALALQTAPVTVAGLEDAAARALSTLRQVMPVHLRAQVDAMRVTRIRNAWDFAAPPIAPETLKAVGSAVRGRHLLRFDYRTSDVVGADPGDEARHVPRTVEPHHLVVWTGRWYLVAWDRDAAEWVIYRVDRIRPRDPTGVGFAPRQLPDANVARLVMTSHDRGDTPARWQCLGSAVLDRPAATVARWAPGGSVVELVSTKRSRLTLGAWSWAGIAGILATFDAAVSDLEPAELRDAVRTLSERFARAVTTGLTNLPRSAAGLPPPP